MERLTDNTDYCTSWSDCEMPDGKCEFLNNCYDRKIYNKLREYEDAEEQGKLIRLPCKIGDEVYQIAGYCWDCSEQTDYCHLNCEKPKYRIRKFIVNHFEVDEKNAIEIHGRLGYSGILGKTVFLTKEEAEVALAEMEK